MEKEAPSRRLRLGLQTQLLAMVSLCVVVPVLTMGAYLLERNEEVLADKARDTLLSHLARKALAVDEWFGERLREASRWSSSFVVYENMEGLAAHRGDPGRARRELSEYLQSVLGRNRVYESLLIADLQGTVVAATREEQLEAWGRERIASQAGSGLLSPIFHSEALGRPTMLALQPIQVPVRNGPTRTVGYFVARVDLRELESLLSHPVSDLAPAAWLLDESGRVVARAGQVADPPAREGFGGGAAPAGGDRETLADADLHGFGRSLFGWSRLQGPSHGFVAAIVPHEVAYRSLEESRRRLVQYGIAAVALILALNVLASRRLLRPIELLSDAARRMSLGELNQNLAEEGPHELAQLTRAFNGMAASVRESQDKLRVASDEVARANEDLKTANVSLERLAITDGLTELYNHRHFQDCLDKEMRRGVREGRPLALLLLDIDHFKEYNDRFGHSEGDEALRRVSGCVRRGVRATDMAFRYGGEELAVLLPACTKDQATEVAEKLCAAVAKEPQQRGRFGARVTVSIGVSAFPDDAQMGRALVDVADAALYQAKAAGRNRVVRGGLREVALGTGEGGSA